MKHYWGPTIRIYSCSGGIPFGPAEHGSDIQSSAAPGTPPEQQETVKQNPLFLTGPAF
jgi:hypothetical protein